MSRRDDVPTTFLPDHSRSIIARNTSPALPCGVSINPYRGCGHGCVSCCARPPSGFLGMSADLDSESRILVKPAAARLLRAELSRRSWKPCVIALSGASDPYQPVERRLRLTRSCLEVLAEFRNPVAISTKSQLIVRDIDLLRRLARHACVRVAISLASLDARLTRALEPRACGPAYRLHTIHRLAAAGIPVGVMVAPVIPGLTDEEVPAILEAAAQAGAQFAGHVPLRLPHVDGDVFADWLERTLPQRKARILARVRALRGRALSEASFGSRMRGQRAYAQQMADLFHLGCRRAGLTTRAGQVVEGPVLSTASFRRPASAQLELFETG